MHGHVTQCRYPLHQAENQREAVGLDNEQVLILGRAVYRCVRVECQESVRSEGFTTKGKERLGKERRDPGRSLSVRGETRKCAGCEEERASGRKPQHGMSTKDK